MNTELESGLKLATKVFEQVRKLSRTTVIIAPPFTHLEKLSNLCRNISDCHIAAQDCSAHEKGAFTGEVSAAMVKSAGAEYVIIGHSERRSFHNENDHLLLHKINSARAEGLIPIFCCGETLAERESGRHFDVVGDQIEQVVFKADNVIRGNLIIAYEPVWAIGTGKTATAQQAGEIHQFIKGLLNKAGLPDVPVLYGGSCNPANAKELFATPGIDGGLIGGASLKAGDFLEIIEAAERA